MGPGESRDSLDTWFGFSSRRWKVGLSRTLGFWKDLSHMASPQAESGPDSFLALARGLFLEFSESFF